MTNKEQQIVSKGVLTRIRANYHNLSKAEKDVSSYVSANPEKVIHMSLIELAQKVGVSDATALRFSRSIGFTGYNDMKMALIADLAAPVEAIFEEINDDDDIPTITRKVFNKNVQLLLDTVETLEMEKIIQAIDTILSERRIYIFAVGTSAALADIFHSRLFRLGLNTVAITDAYLQIMQVSILSKQDALIAISRSGAPPTLCESVKIARNNGAKTIAITCDAHSPVASAAEISITAVAHEIRSEAVASPVTLLSVIDAIYVALVMQNKINTVDNQRKIWEAMKVFR